MLPRLRALLPIAVCVTLALIHGCSAEDGDDAKCAAQSGKDCHACLQFAQCYYCTSSKKCAYNPVNSFLPKASDCSLADVRWGTCWVNFLALIISLVVIVLVIALSIGCWCHCWCKRRRTRSVERDEQRYARERQEREQRQAERRAERQTRTDAIRDKYGLSGTSQTGVGKKSKKNYQRLP
ncbi:pituitary tumor-transforming gene 1 protein-interacting protein-like isoform X1 [Amphibalanus amphitrite]|uniref:pituitary tumor-transforming gene 1 protein-interacting protein-like isoform X1 n=1 Tax=Amphibalanus amphitrite TaxID=1232801 RepID=UPI001C9056D1|nr:pituitary tumor-transforming gene 1 protein-interacting protein-like isoform X1 [Amphibalanus amphitrite]